MPDLAKLYRNVQTLAAPKLTQEVTARQAMLSKPDSAEEEKWYKGDTPTNTEMLARIYKIGQADETAARTAFDNWQVMLDDPGSPFYSPYAKPTSIAQTKLSELGFDMSAGISQQWLDDNAALKNYYRTSTGTTPLAPSSSSTGLQDAAYWYYKAIEEEATTQKAETEWQALQDELRYWAGRSDRNYSDDEILAKINWSDYPTLSKMDENAAVGTPTVMTRSVGYSKDALQGVIWAARNGQDGYNPMYGVCATLGYGKQYISNSKTANRLNPASEDYNPYTVGSTVDDAALYFGVDHFDSGWGENNRSYLTSNDKTARNMYQSVVKAETTTQKAEAELEALNQRIDSLLQSYDTPSDIEVRLKYDFDSGAYPTLAKMDESLATGDLLSTTRAVDYSWRDVEKRIAEACEKKETAPSPVEAVETMAQSYSVPIARSETAEKVAKQEDKVMRSARSVIDDVGTEAEKAVFSVSSPGFVPSFTSALQSMRDGVAKTLATHANPGTIADNLIRQHNTYIADNYTSVLDAKRELDALDADLAGKQQDLALIEEKIANGEDYDGSYRRMRNDTQRDVRDAQAKVDAKRAEYEQQHAQLERMQSQTNQLMALTNSAPTSAQLDMIKVLDFVDESFYDYVPTQWSTQTYFAAAEAEGYSQAQVLSAAHETITEAQTEIDALDTIASYLKSAGVKLDNRYYSNMERYKERLQQDQAEARWYIVRENEDFDQVSADMRSEILGASGNGLFVMPVTGVEAEGEYSALDLLIAMGGGTHMTYYDAHPGDMTEDERKTYLYIRAKLGAEPADYYYKHLAETVLPVRESQQMQETWQSFTADHPVMAATAGVLMSPLSVTGAMYSVAQAIKGEEINPYNRAFAYGTTKAVIGTTNKQAIDARLQNQPVARMFANIGYDAVTSAAESMVNAATLGGAVSSAVGGKVASMGASPLVTRAVSSFAGASPMAIQAAGTAVQDVKMRGGDDMQALMYAGVTFLAEAGTEAITFDNIQRAFSAASATEVRGLWRTMTSGIKNITVAGLEEAPGEMLNELVEGVADDVIMGKLSNHQQTIEQYRSQGMTLEEATQQAYLDFCKDILYAGVVGFVSGGVSSAGATVTGSLARNGRSAQNAINADTTAVDVVENAVDAPANTEAVETPADAAQDAPVTDTAPEETGENAEAPAETTETVDSPAQAAETTTSPAQNQSADMVSRALMLREVSQNPASAENVALLINALTVSDQNAAFARAAAYALAKQTDTNMRQVAETISWALTSGSAYSQQQQQQLIMAICVAAITNGQSHQILQSMIADPKNLYTAENYALMDAVKQELAVPGQSAQVVQTMRDNLVDYSALLGAVTENEVALEVQNLIGQGALAELESYQTKSRETAQRATEAAEQVKLARDRVKAAQDNLQSTTEIYLQDPGNEGMAGMVKQATADVEGATVVQRQMVEHWQKAQQAAEVAKNAEREAYDKALSKIRKEALANVTARQQQAAQTETAQEVVQTEQAAEENAVETPAEEQEAAEVSTEETDRENAETTENPQNKRRRRQSAIPDSEVRGAEAIIKDIATATGITLDNIHYRQSQNVFSPQHNAYTGESSRTVHVASSTDIFTAACEIGNAWLVEGTNFDMHDAKYTTPAAKDYILNKAIMDGLLPEGSDYQSTAGVLFGMYLLSNDVATQYFGPDNIANYEDFLRENDLLDTMIDLRDRIQKYTQATDRQRALESIQLDPPKQGKKGWGELKRWIDTKVVDYAKPLEALHNMRVKAYGAQNNATNDPYLQKRRAETFIGNTLKRCLTTELVLPNGEIARDEQGQEIRGLADILQQVPRSLEQEFNTAWALMDARERAAQNRDSMSRDINIDNALNEILAAHPQFEGIIESAVTWYESFVKAWLIDTNIAGISQEQFETMMTLYPHYCPTYRADAKQDSKHNNSSRDQTGTGMIMRAHASDKVIYNPVMGMVENMQKYMGQYMQTTALRALENTVNELPTASPIAETIDPGFERVNVYEQKQDVMEYVRQNTELMAKFDTKQAYNDFMDKMESELPNYTFQQRTTAEGDDIISFRRADGTITSMIVYNRSIMDALLYMPRARQSKVLQTISRATGFFSSMLTRYNWGFIGQNPLSDIETAMTTGTGNDAKRNWVGYLREVLKSGYDIVKYTKADERGEYTPDWWRAYNMEGRIGSRYSLRKDATQEDFRSKLYKEDRPRQIAKNHVKSVAKLAFEAVCDFTEDLTRATETRLKYQQMLDAGADAETARIMAGLAGRESTVDYTMRGDDETIMPVLRATIPFLNASLEGVYKTTQLFTEKNAGERRKIATRILTNGVLTNLVLACLRGMLSDDEEKEYYDNLQSLTKSRYYVASVLNINGNPVRLKRSQDALIMMADAIGDTLGATLSGYETDPLGALVGAARSIAECTMIDASPVWQTFVDASNNTQWSGSAIESYALQDLPEAERYDADTLPLFRQLSLLCNAVGVEYSPLDLEYIVKQMTGSMGQIGFGILDNFSQKGASAQGVAEVIGDYFAGKFSVDYQKSTEITNVFYENRTKMQQMIEEVDAHGTASALRRDLTSEEFKAAVEEAQALLRKDGAVGAYYAQSQENWRAIKALSEDDTLTDAEKDAREKELRRQILADGLVVNGIVADYWAKYGYSTNFAEKAANYFALISGADTNTYTPPTDFEQMPQLFQEDADADYMRFAMSVYDETGNATHLPHPAKTFKTGGVEYTVPDADWDSYCTDYRDAYSAYIAKHQYDEDKAKVLSTAHSQGARRAREIWLEKQKQ